MELLSVNVGLPQTIFYDNQMTTTAIFKYPVLGRVMLTKLNLEGDGQGDLKNHGGLDKAVYIYSFDHYTYWQQIFGEDSLILGQFGENFTVSGMLESQVHIGDIFQVGEAIIQVTQPRTPCYKLGIRLNKPDFPKQFLESGKTGFYIKVLQEGTVGQGDICQLLTPDPQKISVFFANRLLYFESENKQAIKQLLSVAALSDSWRKSLEKKLSGNKELG